ncbi:MAG: S8 family serine peptidase [Actinobacteria bacterium]|nr:S8 family serine peptidase [Actinomycetota bacterium]
MRIKSLGAGVVLSLTLLIAAALPAQADLDANSRLLVTFKEASAVARVIERFGGQRVGPNGWAGKADATVMRGLARVTSVAPDGIMRAAAVPNDPCVNTCDGKSEWYLPTVGAPSAWDRTRGDGVTIAILDSGIDTGHPDLAPKIDGSVDMTDVHDGIGIHGTEVAGVAGAATNNAQGVASLGWNARLLSVKVLDQNGEGFTSWVINGIFEAVNRGAKVINLSLASTEYEQPLQDAINNAYNKGVLVVAAAGNNDGQGGTSTSPKYPAAMNHVLSVAATMQNDTVAAFSRRGATVDMAAPGNGLVTTGAGGTYVLASGTSLAAPVVSAAAALVIAQGLETSPDAVTAQLVRTGQPLNDGVGGVIRRLNVGFATETAAPYSLGFGGGNSVAVGNVDPAPGEEIVTAAGPGGGPHVRVFSAAMDPMGSGFQAYSASFRGGVDVTVGDVLPDVPGDEIVTGAGAGGGPHVRVFLGNGLPAPGKAGDGFFAYGAAFTGGVTVAVGDVRPDVAGDEIITGAASNGGPHVRIFSAVGAPLDNGGFFAFDPGFGGGVQVAVGNFDGNNGMEIAVAAGPGGGPHVKLFHADGSALSGGFFAYAPNFGGGVDIAAAQVDVNFDEIITVPRTGGGPHLRSFHPSGDAIGGGVFAFDASITTGLTVAAGEAQIVVGTRGGPTLARALPISAVT